MQYAQTQAIADSLLALKQTHAAELAKRDAAIGELQSVVGRLQGFLEGQQNPSDGHSQTAEGQQDDSQRQQRAANGQDPTSIAQEDPTCSHSHIADQQEVSRTAANGVTKGSLPRKEAIGPVKGKARQSIDGISSRQGPKAAVKATPSSSRAAASLSKGGPSTPKGVVNTQTDQQQRRPLTELSENEVCISVDCFLPEEVLSR